MVCAIKKAKKQEMPKLSPAKLSHYTACHIITFQDFCVGGSKGKGVLYFQ